MGSGAAPSSPANDRHRKFCTLRLTNTLPKNSPSPSCAHLQQAVTARPARLSRPLPPPQPAPSNGPTPSPGRRGWLLSPRRGARLRRNINSAPCLFQAERERGPVLVISAAAAQCEVSVSHLPGFIFLCSCRFLSFLPFSGSLRTCCRCFVSSATAHRLHTLTQNPTVWLNRSIPANPAHPSPLQTDYKSTEKHKTNRS